MISTAYFFPIIFAKFTNQPFWFNILLLIVLTAIFYIIPVKLSFVIADKSDKFVKQLRTKEIKYQAQVYPEKTILLIAEKAHRLTLLQAVTDTGLELETAEKILNKLLEKGIAEKYDGSDYYHFKEYSDKYMKNIEKGLRKKLLLVT